MSSVNPQIPVSGQEGGLPPFHLCSGCLVTRQQGSACQTPVKGCGPWSPSLQPGPNQRLRKNVLRPALPADRYPERVEGRDRLAKFLGAFAAYGADSSGTEWVYAGEESPGGLGILQGFLAQWDIGHNI